MERSDIKYLPLAAVGIAKGLVDVYILDTIRIHRQNQLAQVSEASIQYWSSEPTEEQANYE